MTNPTPTPLDLTDLIGPKTKNPVDLSDLLPPKPTRPRAPIWTPTALITVYRETTCTHCGHVHTDPNPLLLLRESSTPKPPKGQEPQPPSIRETATPDRMPRNLHDLPIEPRFLPMTSVPFCSECLDTLTPEKLRHIFTTQNSNDPEPKPTQLPNDLEY